MKNSNMIRRISRRAWVGWAHEGRQTRSGRWVCHKVQDYRNRVIPPPETTEQFTERLRHAEQQFLECLNNHKTTI